MSHLNLANIKLIQDNKEVEWTSDLDKLLRKWKLQIGKRESGHLELARKYTKRHYIFGVPATLLYAIVTTGILATFKNCGEENTEDCDSDQYTRLTVGILSIFGTALGAFQTFMNYQGKAEINKSVADDYGSLYRSLDTILLLPSDLRKDPISTIQEIRSQYDDLIRKAPTLPQKYDTTLKYNVLRKNFPPPPKPDQFVLEKRVISKNADEETFSIVNSDSSSADIKDILELQNNYDTDDEEQEVCIGVDPDDTTYSSPEKSKKKKKKRKKKNDE